jgi:hypothetical protein
MAGRSNKVLSLAVASLLLASAPAFAQSATAPAKKKPNSVVSTFFKPGNLVVYVEGCGVQGGTCTNVPSGTGTVNNDYGDNQAAPVTLFQFQPSGTTSATYVNSLVLPQTASGANLPLSGEYGSSSEGTINLSGGGQYLTMLGYGINAATFDAAYYTGFTADPYGAAPSGALAQSGSLTGQSYTPVPRVLTLVDANGNVNTATGIFNIFNTNNPRSAYTANGSTAYVSGQGTGADLTGGVFYIPSVGQPTSAPTAITGADGGSGIAQDTRDVQIYNGTLYISLDSKEGATNRSFVGTLGDPPSTSLYNNAGGPTQLTGMGTSTGKVTITTGANSNGNGPNAGKQINISPVNYFFASPSVLYVADSGTPKNNSATSSLGNGGLEKWINSSSNGTGTWSLAYTLYNGLNLVANSNSDGTSGLYGLIGSVSGNTVQLYATNYTLNDLDPTYLFGITDNLSYTTATQAASETFSTLATAPADSNFKGVSFTPSIPAASVEVTTTPSGLAFTSAGTGCAPGTYIAPITLAWTAGSSCTLSVVSTQSAQGTNYVFSAWQNGTSSTSSTVTVTAPSTTAVYNAAFVAGPSITFSSVSHNFGKVAVGTAATDYTLKVTNTSTTTAYPFAFNFTPANGFTTATNCPASIAASASCEVAFYFTPTSTNTVTDTWSLTPEGAFNYSPSNGGTLTGSGTSSGGLSLTTAGHNFGTQTVGTTSGTYGVVLSNSSSAAIALTLGSVNSPFTSVTNCPATLAAGSSCNLQFTFKPTATGTTQEIYSISGNGGSSTLTSGGNTVSGITLTGTGQ